MELDDLNIRLHEFDAKEDIIYLKTYDFRDKELKSILEEIFSTQNLSYEIDETAFYYTLFKNRIPICIGTLYPISENRYECMICTKKEFENLGAFHSVWGYIVDDIYAFYSYKYKHKINKIPSIYIEFMLKEVNEKNKHLIQYLRAEPLSTELIMKLKMPKTIQETTPFPLKVSPWSNKLKNKFRISNSNDIDIASFCIVRNYMSNKNTCYLFDFNINEDYRGKGYGKQIFAFILKELKRRKYTIIFLQVQESNTSAFKIYKHFKFEVLDKRECFVTVI
jgi:hypothetical protein